MSDDNTTLEIKGLDQLLKALKRSPPSIKVGILGKGSARADGKTNAQIGAHHEFGAPKANIPKRSFLREPLAERLNKEMAASGALDKAALARVVKEGSLLEWSRKIATLAESIVLQAFGSGGFGKWSALKPRTLARKKVKQILIETQQLRNSITSEVKE